MSVQEPIPPTSSVTALRIPIIKKGEYDLWSMKMRQHLLSFHDATNAKTLWTAIKARFGGNEASKKMQKNLLKQQFETFTIGSREELDSAYERFQHILSMLELYDATVSLEDANLKFLRSLPSVWHVVATMIRGQPGLDELEFDDLYNNLKVYELELKGVSNSNSQNIAFLSTEVKGSTLKQSTAEPAHIPKGYTQAISSKVPTAPNCHFARECRFAKYQENRANGRNEKRIVAIEDSNSKACMMSIELMQSTWHFDKMTGLVDFDWSNKVDDALVSLALMATNSEEVTVGSQDVLTQTVKKNAMINPKQTWRPKGNYLDSVNRDNGSYTLKQFEYVTPLGWCSGSYDRKTKDKLSFYRVHKVGYVAFGNDSKGGRISGKGTIKTSCLDFEKVSYVEELKFNLLSVSQICDKKHNVLFTDKECLIYSPSLSWFMKTEQRMKCSYALKTGHVNFKKSQQVGLTTTGHLARRLKEECQRNLLNCIHMDLFGPVSVESVNRKKYCLVVTDDCSKFSWVCDHGTEFKNQLMNEFCAKKGIKREYSIARTPQQNGVAERKNRTLIEAARTMLADSLLPIQFWAEAVNTACYVLNRVLVTKPQMKTPYEILMGRSPNISFMRPFGCPLTILNTLDHLGSLLASQKEGLSCLGYSSNSNGFRVYNRVKERFKMSSCNTFLRIWRFQKGIGPDWMLIFEILTPSMNYIPVRKENYADSKEQGISCDDDEDLDVQQFIVHGPNIHAAQNKTSEERTADKEVPLSSEEQVLHDELMKFGVKAMQERTTSIQATRGFFMGGMCPTRSMRVLKTKWVFRNKRENGVLLSRQSTLGAQSDSYMGTSQKKCNDKQLRYEDLLIQTGLQSCLGNFMPASSQEHDEISCWSMIGCLMYLTASRPDIMFAVCLCARFQVTPKVSHLHAVKRIFRYLKHQPKLGLWYPKDSPFHLEAFSDSDYAGDNHDRRSTSEAEYVAAASCVVSTICIVKYPVFPLKTKHIQDSTSLHSSCYEQRFLQFMRKHSPKLSCGLHFDSSMLEVLKGTPTQSDASFHVLLSVKVLLPSMVQLHHDSDAVQVMIITRKSDETEKLIIGRKKLLKVNGGRNRRTGLEKTSKYADKVLLLKDLNLKMKQGPRDKGKGILVEEPKKKKLTLQQIRALETTNDEEVARKIQAEWDAEEERKRFEELKKTKPKTTLRKPNSLAQENDGIVMTSYMQSIKDYFRRLLFQWIQRRKGDVEGKRSKRLLRKRKATIAEEQPSKKPKGVFEGISMITEHPVIDSPDGEYLIIHRANNHFRAFDTLWEILHILDRQDLYHLYRVVQDYYEHIPPTGLGSRRNGEIIRWRYESTGVHILELENGMMIHMLVERRYPLTRELMQRMLEHKLEVQRETEDALNVIRFVMKQKEDLEREEE
ncbi:putative ribonuclease H-like domain-containing protein [Tanacetum coccineum]